MIFNKINALISRSFPRKSRFLTKIQEELALKAVQGKLKQEDLDEIDDEKSPLDGESSSSSFTVKTEKA